jgi:hypothetical protein
LSSTLGRDQRSTQAEIELHPKPRSALHPSRDRAPLHAEIDTPHQAKIKASIEERGERAGENGRKEKEKKGKEREREPIVEMKKKIKK